MKPPKAPKQDGPNRGERGPPRLLETAIRRRRRPRQAGRAASGRGWRAGFRDTLAAACSRFASKLLGFGFIIVLARLTSEHDFAAYSYLIVLALSFSVLSDVGVVSIAGRDVARGDLTVAQAYRGGGPMILAGGGLAAAIVGLIGLLDAGPGSEGLPLALAAGVVFVDGIFNFQGALLRASGRVWLEAALQFGGTGLFVGAASLAVVMGAGLSVILGAFFAKNVAVALIAQIWLPQPWPLRAGGGMLRYFLRTGLIVTAATGCLTIVVRAAQVVIANAGAVTDIAAFAVASRFGDVGFLVCHTLGFGLFRVLSATFGADRSAGARMSLLTILALGVGGAILAAALVPLMPFVVVGVFGEQYRTAVRPAQIIIGGLPVLAVLFASWFALIADRRERALLLGGLVGVVAAVASGVWIASDPTAATAAWAAVASFTAMAASLAAALLGGRSGRRSPTPQRPETTIAGTPAPGPGEAAPGGP